MGDEKFFILSIDGGGYRGVYAAHILQRMEDEFGSEWRKKIGLITGTSTGAVIAACLAKGIACSEIVKFYEDHGKKIFKKKGILNFGLFSSQYDNSYLKTELKRILGETKLGEISTPMILPATDIGSGIVHVLKSQYDKEFVRDSDRYLYEAVLASCSAPTFFDPYLMNGYLLADGGLWANNPSLVAAIDAKRRLGKKMESLRIFSLGAGEGRKFYSLADQKQGWGLFTRWGGRAFVEMLLNLQAQTAKNMLGLVLDSEQILRIKFESERLYGLDDVKQHKNLVSLADRDFTYNAKKIQDFLGLQKGR